MHVPNHRTKRELIPPNPTYQSNRRSNDVVDDGPWKNDLHTSDCEIEFHTQHQIADHCIGSPPRWTRRASRSTTSGGFPPFWAQNQYSAPSPSPTRRLQVIKESRKSLMSMVEGMPESSYELSLRDIVDDQRSTEEVQQKVVKEDRSKSKFDSKTKREYNKKGQIPRSESMDTGLVMLKMFHPISRSLKKDSKEKTCPKASPMPSPERGENRNGIHRSTSDISWSIQRPFRVASWSSNRKPRQRGCLF